MSLVYLPWQLVLNFVFMETKYCYSFYLERLDMINELLIITENCLAICQWDTEEMYYMEVGFCIYI